MLTGQRIKVSDAPATLQLRSRRLVDGPPQSRFTILHLARQTVRVLPLLLRLVPPDTILKRFYPLLTRSCPLPRCHRSPCPLGSGRTETPPPHKYNDLRICKTGKNSNREPVQAIWASLRCVALEAQPLGEVDSVWWMPRTGACS